MGLIQTLLSVDNFCQAADGSPICPPAPGLGVRIGMLPSLLQCPVLLPGMHAPWTPTCSRHTGTCLDTQMGHIPHWPHSWTCPSAPVPAGSESCLQHHVCYLSRRLATGALQSSGSGSMLMVGSKGTASRQGFRLPCSTTDNDRNGHRHTQTEDRPDTDRRTPAQLPHPASWRGPWAEARPGTTLRPLSPGSFCQEPQERREGAGGGGWSRRASCPATHP